MKGFAWLLGIVAVVLLGMGAWGMHLMSGISQQMGGMGASGIDALIRMGDALGAQAYGSGQTQANYFMLMHRNALLGWGAGGLLGAIVIGMMAKNRH